MSDPQRDRKKHKDDPNGFVKRLINKLGYRDAVRECYENQWLGILNKVNDLKTQDQSKS